MAFLCFSGNLNFIKVEQKINLFEGFANWATKTKGSAGAFILAVVIIGV